MAENHSENWRPVPGFAGRYEISSIGRVRTIVGVANCEDKDEHVLSLELHHRGYLRVRLYRGDKRVWRRVHRMVCEAFVGPKPEGDYTVDHFDFDKQNNSVDNLSWMTRAKNWQRWRDREIQNDSSAPF